MKKTRILTLVNKAFLVGTCCLFLTGCTPELNDLPSADKAPRTPEQPLAKDTESTLSASTSNLPTKFTAEFTITTNGTQRIFTDKKYHNLSTDVYIESENPSVLQVKKPGITWSDFFATLPMSLTKDCLVTGTGQIFCANDTSELKFWLNGEEFPDALEQRIQPEDSLRVEYRKRVESKVS